MKLRDLREGKTPSRFIVGWRSNSEDFTVSKGSESYDYTWTTTGDREGIVEAIRGMYTWKDVKAYLAKGIAVERKKAKSAGNQWSNRCPKCGAESLGRGYTCFNCDEVLGDEVVEESSAGKRKRTIMDVDQSILYPWLISVAMKRYPDYAMYLMSHKESKKYSEKRWALAEKVMRALISDPALKSDFKTTVGLGDGESLVHFVTQEQLVSIYRAIFSSRAAMPGSPSAIRVGYVRDKKGSR